MMDDCYFQEFTLGVQGVGSLVERFSEELTKFLQYQVALIIDSTHEASCVSTLSNNELSGGSFKSSRLVWDLGIIFIFNLVQFVDNRVVILLLEDKQYLGREYCNVPIFKFHFLTVGGYLMGLCQPKHRGKSNLIVGSSELEDLYETRPIPFTICHHQDHFHTIDSWFCGIPTIPFL
jgi:hypothetical protein